MLLVLLTFCSSDQSLLLFEFKFFDLNTIIYQGLSFGGFTLKIEFVVFVYELINYEIIFITCLCNKPVDYITK